MSSSPELSLMADGPADRTTKRVPTKPVAAIFIHAGAGYHSVANERVHLKACHDAARMGMSFLRAGSTATEAVEAAIRVLENNEITNAGYGSNLNIDGIVECDATVVDHLGRSGACGAVPNVKNPICLAKLILDRSSKPLSLRRVPPNILVGEGAKQFAQEHGYLTVFNEQLVSRNARDRWIRWAQDLRRAEARENARMQREKVYGVPGDTTTLADYEKAAVPASHVQRPDHTSAILTGMWNEGQPDSPSSGGSPRPDNEASPVTPPPSVPRSGPGAAPKASSSAKRSFVDEAADYVTVSYPSTLAQGGSANGDGNGEDMAMDDFDYLEPCGVDATSDNDSPETPKPPFEDVDVITDTVGAIAIDLQGHIAAGSSSGGIGMKHRGRIGPAALVGIGTAVVPQDPLDELATSVAAVTSGTGEHMATTLASARCAERLFQGNRRGPGGRNVAEEDEHAMLEGFILDDFMNHPGVRNQPSAGAIGVMAVKKDVTGVYFYFAHNTDSFALASMSSAEREPLCVMSRLGAGGKVAQGGRKVRVG